MKKYSLFVLLFICLFSYNVKADHVLGGYLRFIDAGGGDYKLRLYLDMDCSGAWNGYAPTTTEYMVTLSEPGYTRSISLSYVSHADVTPLCPGEISSCTNYGPSPAGSVSYGVGEFVYESDLIGITPNVLTTASYCSDQTQTYYNFLDLRSQDLTTIANPDTKTFYITATCMGGSTSPAYNTTPELNTRYFIACQNKLNVYNLNVQDIEKDQLVFSLVAPKTCTGAALTYSNSAYSYTNPLSSSSGFQINASTGELTFTPTLLNEVALVSVKVEEYRSGIKIGEVIEDIVIRVNDNCMDNQPPVIANIPDVIVSTGSNFCQPVTATDPDTDPSLNFITLSASSSIMPPATFNGTSSNATANGNFCWDIPCNQPLGDYFVTVKAKDNACLNAGEATHTFKITVVNATSGPCCLPTVIYNDQNDGYSIDNTEILSTSNYQNFYPGATGNTVKIKNDIVLESGRRLTIQGLTFEFGPTAKVVVKPGATLILEGTKFTGSSCNVMWPGVQVWGPGTNVDQTNSNTGKLILRSRKTPGAPRSSIENAYIGIALSQVLFDASGVGILRSAFGGVVKMSGADIKHCKRGIEILNHDRTPAIQNEIRNGCRFECAASLQYPMLGQITGEFIFAQNAEKFIIEGTTSRHNTFTNGNYGIRNLNTPCDPSFNDFLDISNTGIYSEWTLTYPLSFITISDNTFNNCQTAISIRGGGGDRVIRNLINNNYTGPKNSKGIEFASCSRLWIKNNSLISNVNIGIYAFNSFGCQVRKNGDLNDPNSGIVNTNAGMFLLGNNEYIDILCNNFGNYTNAAWIVPNIIVPPYINIISRLPDQGFCGTAPTGKSPASNIFNKLDGTTDIYSDAAFIYWYNDAVGGPGVDTWIPEQTMGNVNPQECVASGTVGYTCALVTMAPPEEQDNEKIKIPEHIIGGRYNDARKLMAGMDRTIIENDHFVKYHTVMTELGEQNKTVHEMDARQEQVVREVANNYTFSSINAQAVLYEVFEEEFPLPYREIDVTGSRMTVQQNTTAVNINTERQPFMSAAYPNPVIGAAKIKYFVPAATQIAFMNIYDVTGKLLKTYKLEIGMENEVTVNTSEFSNGLYIYTMSVDRVEVVKNKLTILNK